MTRRKKTITITIISVVGVLLVLLVFKKPSQRPPAISLPPPKIPKLLEGEYPISLQVSQRDFDFPGKMSALQISPSSLKPEQIEAVAKSLGYGDSPIIVEDTLEGTTYIYQGKTSSIVAVLKAGKIDYTLYDLPQVINKQLSDLAIVSIAKKFLVDNKFVSGENLGSPFLSFLKDRPGEGLYPVSKEKATIYQVNFSPDIAEFPIITLNPQNSPTYVQVLPDGTVFSARSVSLGSVSKTLTEYKLKNYQEVLRNLSKAILISLDDGNVHLPDIPVESVKKIEITSISLAFLLESSKTKILQPIFVFEGIAQISNYPSNIKAALYLPAGSNQP